MVLLVSPVVLCSGRILISAREDIDEKKVEPEEPHKKKTNAPAPGVMPHESMYTFKSLVLAGGGC